MTVITRISTPGNQQRRGYLFLRGPLDASLIGFIEPLLNPVWVFIFVGERPSQYAILGGTIIVITILAHTLNQYRKRSLA